jgi:hypothetical protein
MDAVKRLDCFSKGGEVVEQFATCFKSEKRENNVNQSQYSHFPLKHSFRKNVQYPHSQKYWDRTAQDYRRESVKYSTWGEEEPRGRPSFLSSQQSQRRRGQSLPRKRNSSFKQRKTYSETAFDIYAAIESSNEKKSHSKHYNDTMTVQDEEYQQHKNVTSYLDLDLSGFTPQKAPHNRDLFQEYLRLKAISEKHEQQAQFEASEKQPSSKQRQSLIIVQGLDEEEPIMVFNNRNDNDMDIGEGRYSSTSLRYSEDTSKQKSRRARFSSVSSLANSSVSNLKEMEGKNERFVGDLIPDDIDDEKDWSLQERKEKQATIHQSDPRHQDPRQSAKVDFVPAEFQMEQNRKQLQTQKVASRRYSSGFHSSHHQRKIPLEHDNDDVLTINQAPTRGVRCSSGSATSSLRRERQIPVVQDIDGVVNHAPNSGAPNSSRSVSFSSSRQRRTLVEQDNDGSAASLSSRQRHTLVEQDKNIAGYLSGSTTSSHHTQRHAFVEQDNDDMNAMNHASIEGRYSSGSTKSSHRHKPRKFFAHSIALKPYYIATSSPANAMIRPITPSPRNDESTRSAIESHVHPPPDEEENLYQKLYPYSRQPNFDDIPKNTATTAKYNRLIRQVSPSHKEKNIYVPESKQSWMEAPPQLYQNPRIRTFSGSKQGAANFFTLDSQERVITPTSQAAQSLHFRLDDISTVGPQQTTMMQHHYRPVQVQHYQLPRRQGHEAEEVPPSKMCLPKFAQESIRRTFPGRYNSLVESPQPPPSRRIEL